MIDWEEISQTEDPDELKEVKLWLVQENERLESERARLEQEYRRQEQERRRLKEENLFFDKKMAILQDGFRKLEEDRKSLEREKILFEAERKRLYSRGVTGYLGDGSIADVLFRNANNPLALRKRYRDLVKIFHPDNLAGDAEVVQMINREFARRKGEE